VLDSMSESELLEVSVSECMEPDSVLECESESDTRESESKLLEL